MEPAPNPVEAQSDLTAVGDAPQADVLDAEGVMERFGVGTPPTRTIRTSNLITARRGHRGLPGRSIQPDPRVRLDLDYGSFHPLET